MGREGVKWFSVQVGRYMGGAGGGQFGVFLPTSHDCTGRRFLAAEYSYPSVIVQGTDHDICMHVGKSAGE